MTVTAGNLAILDQGSIASRTLGEGNAGKIKVQAGRLMVAGAGSEISSDAQIGLTSDGMVLRSSGHAGSVTVTADSLDLREGGEISSDTFAEGNAGTVTVEAGRLVRRAESALWKRPSASV